jgi:hypothetical protein
MVPGHQGERIRGAVLDQDRVSACRDDGASGATLADYEAIRVAQKSARRLRETCQSMPRLRALIPSIVILAQLATLPALAQTQTQQQSKPASAVTTRMGDVSTWSRRQWNAAKAKWSQEKAKRYDCRKQAHLKNLSGRKSWTFLYNCMTK